MNTTGKNLPFEFDDASYYYPMMPDNAPLLLRTLLRPLGRHGSQDQLLDVLRQCEMDSAQLLRQGLPRPYPTTRPQHRVTVLMQHFKPASDQQNHT